MLVMCDTAKFGIDLNSSKYSTSIANIDTNIDAFHRKDKYRSTLIPILVYIDILYWLALITKWTKWSWLCCLIYLCHIFCPKSNHFVLLKPIMNMENENVAWGSTVVTKTSHSKSQNSLFQTAVPSPNTQVTLMVVHFIRISSQRQIITYYIIVYRRKWLRN